MGNLAPGRYQPQSRRGQELLGHELTHVESARKGVQQHKDTGEIELLRQGVDVQAAGIVAEEVNFRTFPSTDARSQVRTRLALNTHVFVNRELPDGWYEIMVEGEHGYVAKRFIKTNLPEPRAILHRIASGESAIGIAEKYYKAEAQRWGQDLRFFVNVLEYVNRGPGDRGIYKPSADASWEKTRVRAGFAIWIPSVDFARTLRSTVKSGSISYEAWQTAKQVIETAVDFALGTGAFVAGLLHGALESLWDILVGLKDLVVLIAKVLKSLILGEIASDAAALWDDIKKLDVKALVKGWLSAFAAKWNHESVMKRWHFRGWVIGYAIAEVAVAVLSGGLATGAKWAGKAAKLASKLAKLLRIQNVLRKLEKMKAVQQIRKLLKGGAKLEDAGDVGKSTKRAGGASKGPAKAVDDALSEGIPRHTSARLGEPSSAEIKSLRKKYSLDSDSEAAALWHVEHQKSTKAVIAGEREIKKALGIDPNKAGEKMTDLLKTDNRGLKVPIEVKNQKEIHLAGKGNAALAKFENIAKHADTKGISHFEILCHLDSKLPPNFRLGKDGVLFRLISGSSPPRWEEVVIGGKKVLVKAGALGEISR